MSYHQHRRRRHRTKVLRSLAELKRLRWLWCWSSLVIAQLDAASTVAVLAEELDQMPTKSDVQTTVLSGIIQRKSKFPPFSLAVPLK